LIARKEISWIIPMLGISGYDALYTEWQHNGYTPELREFLDSRNIYIINTAGEINGREDIKIPVEPSMGAEQTLKRVDMLADIIHEQLYSFKRLPSEYRVIVHCAVGMERSVLATAWYMQKYLNYTLDSAYQKIREIRPIALDRSSWIGKKLETEIEEFDWNEAIYAEDLEPVRYTV